MLATYYAFVFLGKFLSTQAPVIPCTGPGGVPFHLASYSPYIPSVSKTERPVTDQPKILRVTKIWWGKISGQAESSPDLVSLVPSAMGEQP